MEYIQADKDEPEGGAASSAGPRGEEAERVLARAELAFVILNKFPYNPGHMLVVPVRHVGELEDLDAGRAWTSAAPLGAR